MAVVSVDEVARTRLTEKCPKRQPAIKQACQPADSAGFRGVCMNNVRLFAAKEAVKLPNSESIFWRNLAAHLRNKNGGDAHLCCEIAHVVFARGNCAGNQERLKLRAGQALGKPNDMFRWPANIEAGDDANDLCSICDF